MKLLFIIIVTAMGLNLSAQSAFTISHSHDQDLNQPSGLSVASLRNPWIGGSLVYNVSGDVSDFFQLAARAQYAPIQGENFAIPFVTTVDLTSDSLVTDNGVDIGVFPWVNIGNSSGFALLLHGGLNYTIAADQNDHDLFTLVAGLEMAIWGKDDGQPPITLSAAPVLVFQAGGESENTSGLEITGVIPIANGLGFLLQGTVPFSESQYFRSGLKAGIIANGLIR